MHTMRVVLCGRLGSYSGILAAMLVSVAPAAATADLEVCAAVESDLARLACYDRVSGRQQPAPPASAAELAVPLGGPSPDVVAEPRGGLANLWELGHDNDRGTFRFTPYRQNYALVKLTSRRNQQPFRELGGLEAESGQPLDGHEVQFQLSFKTKVLNDALGTGGNLWFGYTQRSHWQIFNREASRPFRETNFEPELMWVAPLSGSLGGLGLRHLAVGINHQSNGRSEPLSRSWNRLFLEVGAETERFALWFRPWWRIPESSGSDDNPDIQKYIGRGELVGAFRDGEHQYSLRLRNNFSLSDNRGSITADWSFPLSGKLRGYMRLFSGYGESMIDYNWSQTTIGFGIILTDRF